MEAQEPVVRDDHPITNNYLLYDTISDTALVATIPDTVPNVWHSSSQRILVRSDYLEAEHTVLATSDDGMDASLVTAQPGIGPSPSHSIIRTIYNL